MDIIPQKSRVQSTFLHSLNGNKVTNKTETKKSKTGERRRKRAKNKTQRGFIFLLTSLPWRLLKQRGFISFSPQAKFLGKKKQKKKSKWRFRISTRSKNV